MNILRQYYAAILWYPRNCFREMFQIHFAEVGGYKFARLHIADDAMQLIISDACTLK